MTPVCASTAPGPTAAAAYRWKCQINENSKMPAFAAELPEADHNEIVGWDGATVAGKFLAVFLEDSDQHPRTRRRIELTRELIEPQAAAAQLVESRGNSPLARLMSLVLLGDLVSIYIAVLRGVDPQPVTVIDRLKAALAKEGDQRFTKALHILRRRSRRGASSRKWPDRGAR